MDTMTNSVSDTTANRTKSTKSARRTNRNPRSRTNKKAKKNTPVKRVTLEQHALDQLRLYGRYGPCGEDKKYCDCPNKVCINTGPTTGTQVFRKHVIRTLKKANNANSDNLIQIVHSLMDPHKSLYPDEIELVQCLMKALHYMQEHSGFTDSQAIEDLKTLLMDIVSKVPALMYYSTHHFVKHILKGLEKTDKHQVFTEFVYYMWKCADADKPECDCCYIPNQDYGFYLGLFSDLLYRYDIHNVELCRIISSFKKIIVQKYTPARSKRNGSISSTYINQWHALIGPSKYRGSKDTTSNPIYGKYMYTIKGLLPPEFKHLIVCKDPANVTPLNELKSAKVEDYSTINAKELQQRYKDMKSIRNKHALSGKRKSNMWVAVANHFGVPVHECDLILRNPSTKVSIQKKDIAFDISSR